MEEWKRGSEMGRRKEGQKERGSKGVVKARNLTLEDLVLSLPVLPPYIPSVAGPDDTSNFDVLEPQKEERLQDFLSRDQGESSGKTLPFVGFTFTRYSSPTGGYVGGTLHAIIR